MIFSKILKHFKSFTFIKNKKKQQIFIGYQDKPILKQIFKKSLFFDPLELTPFNFKILLRAVQLFFYNFFFYPKKLNIPLSHFLFVYFLLAYIKINKVKKITFLNHYDKIINSILPFLNNIEIYLIEHSLNFKKIENSQVKIFTNCISLKDGRKNNNQFIELGSIKVLFYLEKLKKWNIFEQEYKNSNKEIIYISTLSGYFWKYSNFFNYDLNYDLSKIQSFLGKINPLKEIQNNNDLLKMRFLDNLAILGILKNLERLDYKISIISRNTESENKDLLKKEKEFYHNNFEKINFYEFNEEQKYEFLFNNKDKLFLTDYSYFGFEALSTNIKCIFFSKYLRKYFLNFFNSNLIMSNENVSNIIKQINFMNNIKLEDMKKFKKDLQKQYYLPAAIQGNLKSFIKTLN